LKVSLDNFFCTSGRGIEREHGSGRGRQGFNRATIKCFKCHKLGHYQYEYPSLDKDINYAGFDEEE